MSGALVAATPSVRAVDASADARWDAYVAAHPEAVVYHHSAWLRTLSREYGRQPLALVAEDATGAITGLLPLMATRGMPLAPRSVSGTRLASLPRTPVAGPIADDDATRARLARAAMDHLPAGATLQLRTLDARLDGLVDSLAHVPWSESYVVELPDSPDDVRFGSSRNHARIRWAVNKARKEGVSVREASGPGDLRRWHRLYLATMRHHVNPPRPLRLFTAIWDELRPLGMMRLLLAECAGQLLAGSLVLQHGARAFYAFNGVERTMLSLRPNEVLQWDAIHGACAAGCRRYDLGEVVEHQEGLADFKRKWGAHPERVHRFLAPPPAEPIGLAGDERGRAALLGRALWRRVPLRATARAGDIVYRYL